MLQIRFDLDLTKVFGLKKSPTRSLYLNLINIFMNVSITEDLKILKKFKTRLKLINQTGQSYDY